MVDAGEQVVPHVGRVLDIGPGRAVAVREPRVAAPVLGRAVRGDDLGRTADRALAFERTRSCVYGAYVARDRAR